MRTPALALVLLVAAGAALAGDERPRAGFDLPPVLTRHGFGKPQVPVTVTLASPIGDKTLRPHDAATGKSLPHETSWIFRDPAPVWRALRGATTRRFLQGQFPGADPRLTIETLEGGTRRRIHLHYRAGHGDISVRHAAPHGRTPGGAWEFDPAADAALIALLSRTQPTFVGAPVRKVYQVHALAPDGPPRVRVLESAQALEELEPKLSWRYPRTSSWKLPTGFDWKTHVLVLVQLPRSMQRKQLTWGNGRIRDGVMRWTLWTRDDDPGAKPSTLGSALVGAFERPDGMTHVRADIGTSLQVERRVPMNDDYHTPQPDAAFLHVVARRHAGKTWIEDSRIEVRFDGHYTLRALTRRRGGTASRPVLHGRIPLPLCMRLRRAFRATPSEKPLPETYTLPFDDAKGEKPDGIRELVDYIARVHRDP